MQQLARALGVAQDKTGEHTDGVAIVVGAGMQLVPGVHVEVSCATSGRSKEGLLGPWGCVLLAASISAFQ